MPSQHAKHSPSSAYRWINCAGSVELCKDIPREVNEAARIGTAAHALCEMTLRRAKLRVDESWIGQTLKFSWEGAQSEITVDAEMVGHCNVFLEAVRQQLAQFSSVKTYIEKRINLTHIYRGMFGTADVVIDAQHTIVVSDFKYGLIPVHLVKNPKYLSALDTFQDPDSFLDPFHDLFEADINPQLLIYAAGVASEYLYLPQYATLQIVQPRSMEVPAVQTVTIPVWWLQQWSENVLAPAVAATERPNAALNPGSWCRYCPAAGICPALQEHISETTEIDFQDTAVSLFGRRELSNADIQRILQWKPVIENWFEEISRLAFERMIHGETIPGYKLIHGRSSRDWNFTGTDGTAKLIQAIVSESDMNFAAVLQAITEPSMLKSPAQIEKLGTKFKKAIQPFIKKTLGNLTIAPEHHRSKTYEPLSEFETAVAEDITTSLDDYIT